MKIDDVLELNFKYAGAFLEVNHLIVRGWHDMTGASDDSEWIRYNSTWVEYVEKAEGVEYRVQCSLSPTLVENDDNGYKKPPEQGEVLKAHELKILRKAFFRRIHVWICDENEMTFKEAKCDIPSAIIERIESDLAGCVLEPVRLFAEDMVYQTIRLGEKVLHRNGSLVDQQFYILQPVIENEIKHHGVDSVARLLTPFARALLTNDDPRGRQYALEISDPKVIEMIADWAQWSDFHPANVALFQVAKRKGICEKVGVEAWVQIATSAIAVRAYTEAAEAIDIAFNRIKTLCSADERSPYLSDLYWVCVACGRDLSEDTDGFRQVVDSFAHHLDAYRKPHMPKLWVSLARCCIAGERPNPEFDAAIKDVVNSMHEEERAYDEAHKSDPEYAWFKGLPIGVKAPLEWQALMFASAGSIRSVLKAFPKPLSFDEDNYEPFYPPNKPVKGFSFSDIWIPFEEEAWSGVARKRWIERTTRHDGRVQEVKQRLRVALLAEPNNIDSYQIIEPESTEQGEIGVLNITAKGDDDDEAQLMMTFPWLLKQHEANRVNIVCKLRRYSVWQHGGVAEAVVETNTGQRITAIMPYFVADYRYCVRGIRFEGILAGFARNIKVLTPSRLHRHCNPAAENVPTDHCPLSSAQREVVEDDDFCQQVLPGELTGAGFGMVGRVRSCRTLSVLGINLLAVEVECSQLDHPLRVYICAARVKDQLSIGDTVEVTGWLYIDLFKAVDDLKKFKLAYPVSAPKDVGREPWGSGVPVYVPVPPPSKCNGDKKGKSPEPNWHSFGRSMLESCKGVLRVETCPPNPLGVNYLVHTGDQVLKYRMVVAIDDEAPIRDYPGVETFLLRLKAMDHGYNLSWEDLPEFGGDDSDEENSSSNP